MRKSRHVSVRTSPNERCLSAPEALSAEGIGGGAVVNCTTVGPPTMEQKVALSQNNSTGDNTCTEEAASPEKETGRCTVTCSS